MKADRVSLPENAQVAKFAAQSLNRLRPRVEERFAGYALHHPQEWAKFMARLEAHFERLFLILHHLYGNQYDFFYHLEALLYSLGRSWVERSDELKTLDAERERRPDWFLSNQMLGGVCYVDLFAGNLKGICERIPYFKEMNLTYLHLMPLFRCPPGENDGGYAISSYREVDSALGTMEELSEVASELRRNGISLVLDFVFNHTSNQHEWALRAQRDEAAYAGYYWLFPDRCMPDAYEANLREIFPDEHPGAFTYLENSGCWVWTTFHAYQWDLNYQNPEVFIRMAEEMLFLANVGVEVLRLDAVAFIWKQLGTNCENLPEAHLLIQAFNLVARIAAPALLFKSEAIVHPDEVARYISTGECPISYNPLLMALLWESLATREVSLLNVSLRERFALPEGCAWVNYVRCHDDIGWTFSDEDANGVGIQGFNHRRFLNDFYTGRFTGSFSRGLPFQENPKTGDCRISGSAASLAGLEKALNEETEREVDLAIRRILLLHGIILTIGGIPLIYLGDELGALNDYTYRSQPEKAHDSRWVHRPAANPESRARRHIATSVEGRIFAGLLRLISLRKNTPAFQGHDFELIDTADPHVFGFLRMTGSQTIAVLANFSEQERQIPANLLRLHGLAYRYQDLLSDEYYFGAEIPLAPYQMLFLVQAE